MKGTLAFVLGALAATGGALLAQAPAGGGEFASIVAAAPANQREGATVVKWKPDFTYDTLQKGSSNLVCYDLSGYPGHPPFTVECTSTGNLARVAQNLKIEAMGDKQKVQAAFDAAEKDGSRVKPEFGSAFIHFMGPDQEHARQHTTIAVPGATAQSLGLPDKPNQSGAWIMNAGTSTAHIMIPGS